MLPTIDISLIGIILAVWNVFKVIWDYTSKAFNWITQQALALLIGSKFWATAAFLVAAGVIIGFSTTFLSAIANRILSAVFPSGSLNSQLVDFIGLYIDTSELTTTIAFLTSCIVTYHALLGMDFTRRLFQRIYITLSQGWKT